MKSCSLVVALLLGTTSFAQIQKEITQTQKIAQDIAVFKAVKLAREQVSQEDKLDQLDNYLDRLNHQIRENLKNDVDVSTTYIEQNLQRWKTMLNKATVRQAVDEAAFQNAEISSTKVETKCNMDCVKTCYRVTENRFQEVDQTLYWCAVPICDCKQND